MNRFLIYSSVLVLGLLSAALAEANELDTAISASVSDQTSVDAPGADAMTYFASGQHLKNQTSMAQQVQAIEPASGTPANQAVSAQKQEPAPVSASLQGNTEIFVEQGKIAAKSEGERAYAPCTEASEAADECAQGPAVEDKSAAVDPSEFAVKDLNDQLPQDAKQDVTEAAATDAAVNTEAAVKSEKVMDTKTGIKTNIIMNTDTGVDISQ